MIRWSREQLPRPAKHLTTISGSCESRIDRPRCFDCGKPINCSNAARLCRRCHRNDPAGRHADRVRRRQSEGPGYLIAPFNPDRPNCYYCINYRRHSCAFGFPESDESRSFAADCHIFHHRQ